MYDTCWYAWKQNAAINDLVYICLRFKPADCKNAGLTLTPSVSKATGAKRKNDMTVMIEKRLMLSRDSSFFTISFLLSTFLDWKVTFEAIALQNPAQLKEASVRDASATPPTIGRRDITTQGVGNSPRKMAERRTEKKGSMALIVCVNDTATLPRLMFVKRLPMVWTMARGRIARSCAPEIFGLFRIPVIHMNRAMTVPTVNCTVVMFMGYGKAFKTCLL
jgi:hypothetical protein